ncbi:MAG: addiction module protein [Bacteroidota bacterium]
MDAITLKQQALNLTFIERIELARLLLDSIVAEEHSTELSTTQVTELKNRLEAFRRGRMKTISGKELHRRMLSTP